MTGQPSVLYYQDSIFRDAGFGSFAAYASVIVGAAKLVATLFTVCVVDRYGRRPLLFAGISLMLVALLVLISRHAADRPSFESPAEAQARCSRASTARPTKSPR